VAITSLRLAVHRVAADPLRRVLGLWLALGAVAAIRTLLCPDRHTVFPIFADAAAHWWSGQAVYTWNASTDLFRYPPPFAVAVTPFGALGLRAGGILWSWLSLALYGAGLRRFAADVLPGDWTRARTAAFMALAVLVALPGLWNAQSNAPTVGLLLLAASSQVGQRWWSAALLLAAATWLKLTPLPLALLLCALAPRRLFPRFGVALALGFLIPFVTRPPGAVLGQYAAWAAQLMNSGATRWPGFRDGWTAWLVARHLFHGSQGSVPFLEPVGSAYRVVQLLSAASVLAWCLHQQTCGACMRRAVRVTLAMGTAWLMVFGPAVEHATYAFLGPPLAWALLERQAGPGGRWLAVTAFVLIAVLGWDPVVRPWQDRLPLLLATLPIGSALFSLWLIGYTRAPFRPGGAADV
jgi:hypothetical protein